MSKTTGPAAVVSARAEILQMIATFTASVFTRKQACANKTSAAYEKAFKTLVAERAIVALGRRGNAPVFAVCGQGRDTASISTTLAKGQLDALERERQTLANRLAPIPLSAIKSDATNKLPKPLRVAVLDQFRRRVAERSIFTLKIGGRDYFLFASDLRSTLGNDSSVCATNAPSSLSSTAGVAEKITRAYWDLRRSSGLRNVPISDLLKQSGVERTALHEYLNQARRERKANATLGEPTAASKEQLSAALSIEGRPHIFIELFDGGAS